ncbi:hypothetical protein [Mycolicibacter senuensis]|uniref:Uncharacterized protein n=1 Tax=Mycolicibacter senuensis TaxID=386913 RepID=A0A7I9XHR0_9MYCO|nr:hypothetical protein [Mycolicibacter senuensis]MDQ2625640.1 hypothetical protein [Actinomycetota bacterium]GFG69511.1 hypothetical protein MSEN_12310 [Mycolicibacter senuensis]
MPTRPLLQSRRATVFLGIALGTGLGAALAASPGAGADAIDDAWPYLTISSTQFPQYSAAMLPGYIATLPTTSNGNTAIFAHELDSNGLPVDGEEWYTAHMTSSYTPIFGSVGHSEVTAVLDGSGFPNVGTTEDSLELFPFIPVQLGLPGLEPLFTNYFLNDPTVGFADAFTIQGFFGNGVGLTNTFISDAAGIKDVLSVNGQEPFLTLFEFPAVEPDSAVSDLSDLTDFSSLF